MSTQAQAAYLESRVLTAQPQELVRMLYGAATHSVTQARAHLAAGRIAERSETITKAASVLLELAASLDYERGGEISENLGALYTYMCQRLLDANLLQSDAPLEEVGRLLTTLSEAWNPSAPPEPVWHNAVRAESAPAERLALSA